MADRYRRQRSERSESSYYDDNRPRQYEQFQNEQRGQYGDSDDYYESSATREPYGDRSRNRGQRGQSWQNREFRDTAGYDPFGGYDGGNAMSEQRYARQNANHTTFRGDDFGAAEPSGTGTGYSDQVYGGNFLRTGDPSFASVSTDDRGDYRNRKGYGNRNDRGFFEKAGDEIASWFGDEDAERRREMDHSGRGPTNYKRSDERILEDACDRLTDDRMVDARDVTVTVENGEVTLNGNVADRRQKRRAEDCIAHLSGVGHVQNNLRVSEIDNRYRDDTTTNTDDTIS